MNTKEAFLKLFSDLYTRGEMLKAKKLLDACVPLDLEQDQDILNIREEVLNRLKEIMDWNISGRTTESYATLSDPLLFPKFEKARNIIKNLGYKLKILDIGCYTGDFIKLLAKEGHICHGIDIHKELMDKLNKECSGNPAFVFGSADSNLGESIYDVVMAFDVLEHCFDFNTSLLMMERAVKYGGLVIINLPRMTPFYQDEALEHLRMFSDKDIKEIFGNKKNYKFELCQDELGRETSFITYNK